MVDLRRACAISVRHDDHEGGSCNVVGGGGSTCRGPRSPPLYRDRDGGDKGSSFFCVV